MKENNKVAFCVYLVLYQEACSSFTPLGPSLEEKLFSSCDLMADKMAQCSFKSRPSLAEMGPRARVSAQFQPSNKARNWAATPGNLSSVFTADRLPVAPVSAPSMPPSAADSSPQTSSDSGETSAVY